MRARQGLAAAVLASVLAAAACSGSEAVLVGNAVAAAGAALKPAGMPPVDKAPGWKRTGDVETFKSDGLYGHIDGGAEIVLQYGFRELAVSRFAPGEAGAGSREITLELYRMASGEAAFGWYSTRVEGGEPRRPGLGPDHWIAPGQANLVKGDFVVNVVGPDCTEDELGAFLAAVEPLVPGSGTVRPKGVGRLPEDGMVPGSARYIKGPLAAQNESPFLDAAFWGFGGTGGAAGRAGAAEAYSAKYGQPRAVSKLVVVRLGTPAPAPEAVENGAAALFGDYLEGVARDGATLSGRNAAGRWFLFRREGAFAALVLGDPDPAAARARLEAALARASR